ncbi:MAG: glycosyltransferase family 2 protein [Actinobacteria bacterium]|nr:glycosyltransferase family 2 protein [Actinomycetota bacterium]
MKKQTLSVVVATFNEEKNLSDCLESVKDLATEIIVVDGSSTDKTVEIAKKYGAKVKIIDNPPIFHVNKQKAIDMASSDWILQLDADERVDASLSNEIKSKINDNFFREINGYWIPRKNWFLGKFMMKGGQYPDYTLRLYRRGKGSLPQKSVHEQAIVEGKTEYLKNSLVHMADPEFKRYLVRFNRYTDLIAEELKEKKYNLNPFIAFKYLLVLPSWWFLLTYVRHKGFMDSWQGFLFSFFSALRFPVSYIKYLRRTKG